MKHAYNHRLRLMESTRQRGIKSTARLFAITVPTARKWLSPSIRRPPDGVKKLRHILCDHTGAEFWLVPARNSDKV